jgi:hypothetical protein
MARADGGATPKRDNTEARVSPRRNLTPTRGGSSALIRGGGLGSWGSCDESKNGKHKSIMKVAKATPARRANDASKRSKRDGSKYFRCFITLKDNCCNPSTGIFIDGQRKKGSFLARTRPFLLSCSVTSQRKILRSAPKWGITLNGVVLLNPSTSVVLNEREGSRVLLRLNSGTPLKRWSA